MSDSVSEIDLSIVLVRHGETPWSLTGQHTGRTDVPLTENGILQAKKLQGPLSKIPFDLVLSSPLSRAMDTCKAAGLLEKCQVSDLALEWDYGDYEGVTSAEIHQERPDWNIFDHGAPQGESPKDISLRARTLLDHVLSSGARSVCVFSHGHFLRIFGATWIDEGAQNAKRLALSTGSISRLGHERTTRVIDFWNSTGHL